MDRYLVIVPHTPKDCLRAIKHVEAVGMITHFDWGCKDGDHTGYVVLEADDKNQAQMVVPSFQRPQSHVIKLTKFSPDDVKAMHDKK